jgi:hypothetical protein
MKMYEFEAVIIKVDGIDATYIEFPFSVEEEFGVKGQVKVKATFDGVEYRGSLAKMGHHCHRLGITKDIRNKISKQADDSVHVVVQKDDAPRVIDIPFDLIERFNENKDARNFFDSLSYTNQKKYIDWIEGAKKQETRVKRVADTITKLNNGEKL